MRGPATALITVIYVIFLSCSPLFASGIDDPLKSVTSSLSQLHSGVSNGLQRINTSGATTVNQYKLQLNGQWSHYTNKFGTAGIPLCIIGQVTNPIITGLTGVQPGSRAAQQAGKNVNYWTGGLFNIPIKTLWGRDLNHPNMNNISNSANLNNLKNPRRMGRF